jgi:hypothetical protein
MIRTLAAVLLLLAGSISLAYGLFFHKVTIEEKKQREITVAVPVLPGIDEPSPESSGESPAADEKSPESSGGSATGEVDPFRSPTDKGSSTGDSKNPFEIAVEKPKSGDGKREDKSTEDLKNPFESSTDTPSAGGVKYQKITEDYIDVHEEPESTIVREVTIGGVVLLANGHLKRTYTGKPPALCPT